MSRKQIKCSLLGDSAVGKLCLAEGGIAKEYTSVVAKVRKTEVTIGSDEVSLALFITACRDGFETVRQATYHESDVFMACFSVMGRESMHNISSQWFPEIRSYSETAPILLVGTQVDLRTNEEETQRLWDQKQEKPISTEEGRQLAERIGAKGYIECSAKTGENVKRVMEEAAQLALAAREDGKQKHGKCILQ